jgi:hypothetical protein
VLSKLRDLSGRFGEVEGVRIADQMSPPPFCCSDYR